MDLKLPVKTKVIFLHVCKSLCEKSTYIVSEKRIVVKNLLAYFLRAQKQKRIAISAILGFAAKVFMFLSPSTLDLSLTFLNKTHFIVHFIIGFSSEEELFVFTSHGIVENSLL